MITITDQRDNGATTMGLLPIGSVFDDGLGRIFIKIPEVTLSTSTKNAVRVTTGELENFSDLTDVNLLTNVELVVGNNE